MTPRSRNEGSEPLKLGALDACVCFRGVHPQDVLWHSIEMARRVEDMGYTRYWFSEHHGDAIAHCCPEIMTTVIAGVTEKIHVGSGCVLLRHYSPIKVASTFRLLQALYPGRIDLGVGGGSASQDGRAGLLPASGSTYPDQIKAVVDLASGRSAIKAQPVLIPPPEIWLQGSSHTSASLAAELGTCFCLGIFLNFSGNKDQGQILDGYRRGFKPSGELPEPRCSVAVAGICAETEEQAIPRWV